MGLVLIEVEGDVLELCRCVFKCRSDRETRQGMEISEVACLAAAATTVQPPRLLKMEGCNQWTLVSGSVGGSGSRGKLCKP